MIPGLPGEVAEAAEVRLLIPDRLAWCCVPESILEKHKAWFEEQPAYLSVDTTLVYEQFFADFGPLSLGCTVTYCRLVERLLEEAKTRGGGLVVHYCSSHRHRRTNAAALACLYAVMVLGKPAHDAYEPFVGIEPPFQPYRDAAFGVCTFPLLVVDVLRAAERAIANGHFDYRTFDLEQCETLEKIHNGDVSWIVPGKFVAFSGPLSRRRDVGNGKHALAASDYVKLFRRLGVSCVIRFNKPVYSSLLFTNAGIRHVDLYYEDGTNPPPQILHRFLQICEDHPHGAIAVHCKAGLGRTGTNIAAYLIKHFNYTAYEAIAWLRLCRPGCVIGPQQHFVKDIEPALVRDGRLFREQQHHHQPQVSGRHHEQQIQLPRRVEWTAAPVDDHQWRRTSPLLAVASAEARERHATPLSSRQFPAAPTPGSRGPRMPDAGTRAAYSKRPFSSSPRLAPPRCGGDFVLRGGPQPVGGVKKNALLRRQRLPPPPSTAVPSG